MITSISNAQVKEVAALQAKPKLRQEQGVFVAEGVRLVREIPEGSLVKAYYTDNGDSRVLELANALGAVEVAEPVFRKMSATQTPQGILAVVRRRDWTLDDITNAEPDYGLRRPIIVLEDLQDPGNLGTIVRTGEGAGIAGIVASPGTVDVTNPKVIRGTMGSLFRIPYVVEENLPQAIQKLRTQGYCVMAAALEGSVPYDEPDLTQPVAFLIGNEGNGLTREAIAAADLAIRIPMQGLVESLNAGIAASILMYEANRQRRCASYAVGLET